jgi:transcriptional regulator with XRE-family HTH domain
MNLGENIHYHRTAQNMSQGDLANALNVSRQSVSKWENNTAVPELDKLLKMSELFSITLDELVRGQDSPIQQPQAVSASAAVAWQLPPARVMAGATMLLFGMVFFLLSIFWGDHLRFGEEFGELMSLCILLFSAALLAPHNHRVLGFCGWIYLLYAFVCFAILRVSSMTNYMFMFVAGVTIVIWFLYWGTQANKEDQN